MISRITVRWRWLRRVLSRTHLAARLLGVKRPTGEADFPGLILIQIDGLSRTQMEHAIARGNLPFLARLTKRGHFSLESFYSGIPSTTPAVQGEIFYGERAAVPGFQFFHRESGTVMRMYEAESATAIEEGLALRCPDPLLEDGSSYSNIYRAGAKRSRYCSRDLAPDELLRRLEPPKLLLLATVYAPKLIRMAGLALLELFIALFDAAKGLSQKENFAKEMWFVPARIIVCILLRELIRFRILLDVERGVQVIHGNFLGYDEQSHRRGPGSAFAHWTLKGIDRAIRDIFRTAGQSDFRDYELIVYSDHGQEHTIPFARRHGRELGDALLEAFGSGPLAGRSIWMRRLPGLIEDTVGRFRNLVGLKPESITSNGHPDRDEQIIVTAMGPLGHIYLPEKLSDPEMTGIAREIVQTACVPLVLLPNPDGTARAFNRHGMWNLPRDRAAVLGRNHPFLDEVADDLVRLTCHPDAGEIIISGWDPGQPPLTFPSENGAHCGPGPEETRGFLLVPDRIRRWHLSRLPRTGERVRGEDLRKIALHFLGRDGTREERVAEYSRREKGLPLRVMTYNIHSCLGLDGKTRPERVARVINHFDADIVAVQEVDAHRRRSHRHDQARVIADHLRMTHVFHAMFTEEKERYGIAVFARYPFHIVKADFLTEADPLYRREARGAIWLKVEPEGQPSFHFINTHFGLGTRERRQQVEKLLGDEWLGSIPPSEPVILCGDFNSGPRSEVFRRLRGRWSDVQEMAENHRPLATFSSIHPLLRLDHVFVSSHFKVNGVDRPRTLTASIASDHLPLCAELTLS